MKFKISKAATSKNIVDLLKADGIKPEDIMEYFDFESTQAYYNWKEGKTLPDIEHLYNIARLLDKDIEELIITE